MSASYVFKRVLSDGLLYVLIILALHALFLRVINRSAKYRSKEQEELMELELIDPQTLSFEFVDSKGPIDLHKLP